MKFANELLPDDFGDANIFEWFELCFGGLKLVNDDIYDEMFACLEVSLESETGVCLSDDSDLTEVQSVASLCSTLDVEQQVAIWEMLKSRYQELNFYVCRN